jgi:hypothetical protein
MKPRMHVAGPPLTSQPHPPPLTPPTRQPTRRQVYLISFVLLLTIMLMLLSCHCWRLCRMAQRMEASYLAAGAPAGGVPYHSQKRSTPDEVIAALPVVRYGALAAAAAAAGKARAGCGGGGGGQVELVVSVPLAAAEAGAAAASAAPAAAAAATGAAPPQSPNGVDGEEEPCAVCYDDFESDQAVKQLPCGGWWGLGLEPLAVLWAVAAARCASIKAALCRSGSLITLTLTPPPRRPPPPNQRPHLPPRVRRQLAAHRPRLPRLPRVCLAPRLPQRRRQPRPRAGAAAVGARDRRARPGRRRGRVVRRRAAAAAAAAVSRRRRQ